MQSWAGYCLWPIIVLVEETQMANRATDWTRLRVSVVVWLTAR
jgi:hypothetical protein